MSTFRKWAFWRRVQYISGVLCFLTLVSLGVYRYYFYDPGNCFDNVMSGNETGVDCGGACVRICAAAVVQPKIVWAESFEIVEGKYNAVAYIENSNQIAATPELQYTFELLSGSEVVATIKGTTLLPPNSIYPIFEGRIDTGGKKVTETKLTLEAPSLWLPASIGREQFESSNINLTGADARPRLDAVIKNTALTPADKIEIVATLFNDAGTPITASQTFIDRLEARSTKDIVFTWPTSIAKTVRSCVIPTDVAVTIDLSGSMNNDGGDPPQPVTDALAAAKVFVSELKKNDQATIVTFATEALLAAPLNKNHSDTATLVGNLTIDPKSETGFTNTSAALREAAKELASERHNGDARRVMVLLTDGLPTATDGTADPVAETRVAAKEAVDAGVELYVIGLGKNVDLPFITSLTAKKENAFYAPTTADLGGIYKNITSSLCESGASKIEVIAKTPTNFAPLR